jgi:hypothetical protein
VIIALTLATALIHISLGGPLFILNGVGYIVLLVALYWLPQTAAYRTQIRYALIGYTAITIGAYFLMNGDLSSTVGMLTKVIELTLLVLLWREGQPAK